MTKRKIIKQLKKPDLGGRWYDDEIYWFDLGNAVDELVKGNNTKAKVSQKKAAGNMKAMSKKMASSMSVVRRNKWRRMWRC
jgi:hypothetical protein